MKNPKLIRIALTGTMALMSANALANFIDPGLGSPSGDYYVYASPTYSQLGVNGSIYDTASYGNYVYANIGGGQIARWN